MKVDGDFEGSFNILNNLSSIPRGCSTYVVCEEGANYSTPALTWKAVQGCAEDKRKSISVHPLQGDIESIMAVVSQNSSLLYCNLVLVLLFEELLQELR